MSKKPLVLCIDVGNTRVSMGLVRAGKVEARFSLPSDAGVTPDSVGVFMLSVLARSGVDLKSLDGVSYASVVPRLDDAIGKACQQYLGHTMRVLTGDTQSDLFIGAGPQDQLGSDRVASAIGALYKYPRENLIVVDLGTATTVDAIDKDAIYRGGLIMAGVQMLLEALSQRTALLPYVPAAKPESPVGRTTVTQLQAGMYYSHVGAIREILGLYQADLFSDQPAFVVATGGLGGMLSDASLVHTYDCDLHFTGLYHYWVR